jgi:Tol biopolymer transport system component
MMFHARGAAGGTILYDKGKVIKIDFKSIGLKKNTTYPSWHPEGRFIAFSANTTHQIFFTEGHQGVEVFDTASDLTIYDIETGEAITDPRFSTEDALESFPSWSPEGDYLYFVSYKAQTTPVVFTPDMQYSLLRVPFNCKTRTFGEKVDTLYNAPKQGGSVSYPRISADGKYLLYTLSDYGTFPIWHDEADLRMMDLTTMKDVDVSIWNDDATADSFHNWSSNGRWAVFGSRRVDGRYTRLMIAYMDKDGKPHKPFLLPQEDPRHNTWRLRSYNVPEFIKDKVSLPKEAEKIFCPEN